MALLMDWVHKGGFYKKDSNACKQDFIIRSILPSGMGARGVSSEHVENIENMEMSK